MLGCSIMCDKALKTIRSKSNREENPINIALQTGIFLKAHMLGFFFFALFSTTPIFSEKEQSNYSVKKIKLITATCWVFYEGKPQSCCVQGLFCDLGGTERWFHDLSYRPHDADHSPGVPHPYTCSVDPHLGAPAPAWHSFPLALTRAGSILSLEYLVKNWILPHRSFSWLAPFKSSSITFSLCTSTSFPFLPST